MEQQFINALLKLIAKAGGGALVRDLIRQVDQDGNPKTWTVSEIEEATAFIQWQTENFGTAEAAAIVESLVRKYKLDLDSFKSEDSSLEASPDVRGLQ
jgi:hypothetical protein